MLSTMGSLVPYLVGITLLSPLFILITVLYTYLQDSKGLRKYPNQNWLSGLTPLSRGWEVAHKTPNQTHTQRHHEALKRHPVIRIGPNWLSFGRAQAAKDIYGYTSGCVKATPYDVLASGGANLNNISDKAMHSSRRRMVASSYAPKNTPNWEPLVYDSVAAFASQLESRLTKPLEPQQRPDEDDLTWDGVRWIFLFSVETVIKVMVSKETHFLERGSDLIEIETAEGDRRVINVVESIHSVQRAASTVIWDTTRFDLWARLTKALSTKYAENWERGKDHDIAMKMLVEERVERYGNGEILDDLFQPMMEDRSGEEPDISTKDRISEVQQAVGAGSDGPAVSITMTLYYLIRNPTTLDKLRAEVDAVLDPSDKFATWAKIKSLPYLRACIDEAMRLTPPVATELIRRTPSGGACIDGRIIPGDTNVSIAAYTAHRDPTIFQDPEEYIPERWMEKGSDHLKEMLAVFIPFSAGTRGCIGRNVSILMQATCIATMIHRFEFALPDPTWEMDFEEWFNLWPLKMPMKVWPRRLNSAAEVSAEKTDDCLHQAIEQSELVFSRVGSGA